MMLTAEMDTSAEGAARALALIWGEPLEGELVELSVRGGGGRGRGRGRWRSVACTVEEALQGGGLEALRGASAGGADAYIGVAALARRPEAGRRGGAGLRGTAGCLWLDIDCAAPGRDGPDYFSGAEEAVTAVDRALGDRAAAALVVGSGWGVQYFLPLSARVAARTAAAMVRALVLEVSESTGRRADRVWDPARAMRAPGTWNWRSGEGVATGVLRWPTAAALDPGEVPVAVALSEAGAGAGSGGGGGGGVRGAPSDAPLMDLEAAADRTWTWAQILEPAGWRRAETGGGGSRREAEVWTRPGAPDGDRSAVIYADAPGLLSVYSESAETGFGRGAGAGAGAVQTRWRALVALRWAGDARAAAEAAWGPGGWASEDAEAAAGIVAEWCSLAAEAWRGDVAAVERLRDRERTASAPVPVTERDGGAVTESEGYGS